MIYRRVERFTEALDAPSLDRISVRSNSDENSTVNRTESAQAHNQYYSLNQHYATQERIEVI